MGPNPLRVMPDHFCRRDSDTRSSLVSRAREMFRYALTGFGWTKIIGTPK